MKIELSHRPAYAMAIAHLEAGDSVQGEPGSMIAMDGDVAIDTSTGLAGKGILGGILGGLKRLATGESLLRNTYKSVRGGTVCFAPAHIGDMEILHLEGAPIVVQSGAWVCSPPTVSLDASWQGARGFFSGQGLLLLKATGTGPLAIHAFGAIRHVDVDGRFIVDTGHIVAFESSLTYKVRPFGGGLFSFIFGGEGLVCAFEGKGRLWLQTRNPTAFGSAMTSLLPMRNG